MLWLNQHLASTASMPQVGLSPFYPDDNGLEKAYSMDFLRSLPRNGKRDFCKFRRSQQVLVSWLRPKLAQVAFPISR